MKATVYSLTLLSMFTACGGQSELDVGDESEQLGQSLTDYASTWDGYAEAIAFHTDGTDRVRVTLHENGSGTIRFGEEALIAPATDPNGPYPPARTSSERADRGVQTGFEYPIDAQVTSGRLQFSFGVGVFWESWCALQQPEPISGWQCSRGGGRHETDPVTGEPFECSVSTPGGDVPIDCDVYEQCAHCLCDEESCGATDRYGTRSFDAALSDGGDSLEGTLILDDRITVRLTRQ